MFWSIDSCHNGVSADQYHMTLSRAQAQVSTHHGYVFFFFVLKFWAVKVLVSIWSQAQLPVAFFAMVNFIYITECNNEIFSISGCFVGSPNETTRTKRGAATRQETPPPPAPPETFLLHLGVTARTHSIGEFNRKFSSSVDNFVIDQWVRVAYICHLCYSVSRVVEGRCTIKFVACIVEEGKMCCSQGCRR